MLAGFRPLLGEGIFNVDGEEWKSQRKVASYQFSSKAVRHFIIEQVIDRFPQSVIEKRRKEVKLKSDNEKARVSEQELAKKFARGDSDLLSRLRFASR
ncbi:hypothetical protein R1flu_002527 [Riccia fluitans]|uniref:Cytochrome P450 n=1 Tax=Riccia fluitans TaxID=41844 RepID=A0ABD1Y9Q7_9MARC